MKDDLNFKLAVSRLAQSGSITLPSQGYSMFPFIRPSDECHFIPITCEPLRIGRILLFGESSGRLVGHRLIRIESTPSGAVYICKGDTNLLPDEPVHTERIVGILSSISRTPKNGLKRTVPSDALRRVIWGTALIKLPFLSRLLRGWSLLYRTTFSIKRNLL
jgi:signal peptidase